MPGNEHSNETKAHRSKPDALLVMSLIVLVIGMCSLAYCVYDAFCPSGFVGDMSGSDMMFRLGACLMLLFSLVFGGVAVWLGWRRGGVAPRVAGGLLVLTVSLLVVISAVDVGRCRCRDARRSGYPRESIEELLRIAAEEGDLHALDALGARRDPAAVPGLRGMLMNERLTTSTRCVAAHVLRMIGGPEARKAFEDVCAAEVSIEVKQCVTFELETMGAPEGDAPRKED